MERENDTVVGFMLCESFLLDEKGEAYGMQGLLWPDNRRISVTLRDLDAKEAQKSWRPTFESLRNTNGILKNTFEVGGIIRMKLYPTHKENQYTTDWPNVITWNSRESNEQMHYGTGFVRAYTPKNVSRKRAWLQNNPSGIAAVDQFLCENPGYSRTHALESCLQKQMNGEFRYMSFVYLFDVKRSACGSVNTQSKNALCDTLTAYFCNPKFLPQEGRNGLFQPVKPYLLIRSINSQGCVSNYVEFTPKDACVNSKETRFLSPDECVAKTLTLMKNIERWDILPCMVYTFSSERMRMGGGNDNYYIRTVAKQNRASHKISEDGSVQAMAREIGIHVSKGKSIVVKECLFDERIHPTEALLLNASGVPYQKAQERPSEKLEENNPSPRL